MIGRFLTSKAALQCLHLAPVPKVVGWHSVILMNTI